MSCDYPIKCKYWDEEKKRCKLSPEEFQRMAEKGYNPCEEHQRNIDRLAERDAINAIKRGDEDAFWAIVNSPFTNFGKR